MIGWLRNRIQWAMSARRVLDATTRQVVAAGDANRAAAAHVRQNAERRMCATVDLQRTLQETATMRHLARAGGSTTFNGLVHRMRDD
jgi:hypothetical protein